MNRRDLAHTLGRILNERRDRERDVVPRRVVARNADGTESQLRLDGTCPERGEGAHELGEVVTLPTTSHGPRGGSGSGLINLGEADLLWVERQEPRELEAGATQDVVIYGRGLVAGMSFEYLSQVGITEEYPEGVGANPGLTVDEATCIDSERYELTVTVAPDAAVLSDGPIAYTAGGRRRRRDDFYDVVAATITTRIFHVFLGAPAVTLAEYHDGAYVADIGTVTSVYPLSDIYPIYGDSRVAPGSIAWIQGGSRPPRVKVWDWATSTLYQASLPGGWVAHGCAYVAGYLWWVAYLLDQSEPHATLETRLYRATADLTSIIVRGSHTADVGQAVNWYRGYGGYYPALYGPDHCVVVCSYIDLGSEVAQPCVVRFAIPEGGADAPGLGGSPPCHGLAIPVAGRGIHVSAEEGEIGQWDGNATLAPWWPSDWNEAVNEGQPPQWSYEYDGIGRSADGDTVYLFNQDLGRLVIGAADPGPEPEAVIDMEPHPVIGPNVRTRVWPI